MIIHLKNFNHEKKLSVISVSIILMLSSCNDPLQEIKGDSSIIEAEDTNLIEGVDFSTFTVIDPKLESYDFSAFDIENPNVINALDDLYSLFNVELNNDAPEISTRSLDLEVYWITTYGYSSYTVDGPKTLAFNSTTAAYFGLSAGIYVAELYTVKGTATVPENSVIAIGTGNGILPGTTTNQLGYTLSQTGNQITMTTLVWHILSTMSGQTLNIWNPVSSLSDLSWTFGVVL